jgi:hypothetical protein
MQFFLFFVVTPEPKIGRHNILGWLTTSQRDKENLAIYVRMTLVTSARYGKD